MEFLTPAVLDAVIKIVFMGIDFFSRTHQEAIDRKKRFLVLIRAQQAKSAVVAKMSDEAASLIAEIKRDQGPQ